MVKNKDITPSIAESLRMIEEKLAASKTNKKKVSNIKNIKNNRQDSDSNFPSLSDLFKREKKINKTNKINLQNKSEGVLLLTKMIDKNGKTVDLRKKKSLSKLKQKLTNKNKEYQTNILDIKSTNNKVLNNTGDMAAIINKLRLIRDEKINQSSKKKKSKEINKEIKKLNETISLAEELFKKELLDL